MRRRGAEDHHLRTQRETNEKQGVRDRRREGEREFAGKSAAAIVPDTECIRPR